jgi:quinol monooxygenase YgiN
MAEQLFAAVRGGKVKPGMVAEFAKRVKAGALPVMRKMDGFRGYYLIAAEDNRIIAVSLFTNKEVADASTQALMPWIKENLGPLLASPPEPINGTVLVSG